MENPFDGIDRRRLIHPSDTIASFIRRLRQRHYHGEEKRSKSRLPIDLPLIVLPLNINFDACGEPFRAVSFDITTNGIGFIHSRRILAPFAAIEIQQVSETEPKTIQAIIEIRHCEAVHTSLFEMGGVFVVRLASQADELSHSAQ